MLPVDPKPASQTHACCAHKMDGKESGSLPEKSPKDCNIPVNCINCPLCFSGMLSLVQTVENTFCNHDNSYASLRVNDLSKYSSESWKPPDLS